MQISGNEMRIKFGLLLLCFYLTACVSSPNGGNVGAGSAYKVGPQVGDSKTSNQIIGNQNGKLSIVVPIIDPNLPEDSDTYEKKGIWPELRVAEANRFSVKLKQALETTQAFDSVRVYPDASATAELYVFGKIIDSNGEDIALQVEVVDLAGKQRMPELTYKYRVKEYSLTDPRKANTDLYAPVFDRIAMDIAKKVKHIRKRDVAKLDVLDKVRFGESLNSDYFSKYLKRTRSGKVRLLSAPSNNDPMMQNLDAIRVRDQMFTDELQRDYSLYVSKMDEHYLVWQKQAFKFSKEARIARQKATNNMILGVLLVAAGGVASASDALSSIESIAATLAILSGGSKIFESLGNSKAAKEHKEGLDELGQSLNIELADKNIALEGRQVELKGDAEEQAATWRQVLKEYYQETLTPEVSL